MKLRTLVAQVWSRQRSGAVGSPRGNIDWPRPESDATGPYVQVLGWCAFPGGSVARVEVAVGNEPPRRARLGMPREDIAALSGDPSAPVCGWELYARVAAGPVTLRATAYATDGRELELAPVTFSGRLPDRFDESLDRAAELRARSTMPLRPRVVAADDDVRLLVFTHTLSYGGAPLYLLELLRRLVVRPGFECTVVTLQDGPLREDLEALGIPVHLTDGFPVMQLERYEGALAELVGWAAVRRFNVAFVNTLSCFSGAEVASRLGIPVVWSVHESFDLPLFWLTAFPPGALHPYVPIQAERTLRDAAAMLFVADATRRLFVPYADPARLVTLPYGVELDAIRAARELGAGADLRAALGVPDGGRLVLCLGTIEPRKSQGMLVQAFARVAERHPDTVLALVGEVDEPWCRSYAAGVRDFAERSGLAGRVHVEPVTRFPYPWHAAADLLVCASDVESLPRSVTEAMAFETPVVSTRVFGVPDVIEDGVTGYLCDTCDADDLTRTLDRALSADPAGLREITSAAAELVARRHRPEVFADQVWELLSGLASDPRADPRGILFGGAAPRFSRAR